MAKKKEIVGKEEALKIAIKNINNTIGVGSVIFGDNNIPKIEKLSSGCYSLDKALGGGWAKGRIVEIYGPESSGKTTLALHAIAEIQKTGGYAALKLALKMNPEDVIEEVKSSNLRGRGGAGFSAGLKWTFIPKDTEKPKYLINNADESEPGTFKDRLLMNKAPHQMLEEASIPLTILVLSFLFHL